MEFKNMQFNIAPSRFNELPALIHDFDSSKWPILNKKTIIENESDLSIDKKNNKFCVHIHAFYLDEFFCIMEFLEPSFNIIDKLIVTVVEKNEPIKDGIVNSLSNYGISHKSKIILVDNIGRNIKPLLIDAWQEISKFEYCLHLHTKRTKGRGKDYGRGWLNSICNSIATKIQIEHALYLLNQNPTMGVILPAPFEDIATHSMSWAGTSELMYKQFSSFLTYTQNKCISKLEFFSKLLIYGVGGMMLFRVSALDQMQKWINNHSEYLYVPEPLPTQSNLHAIERLFVWCAEYANYSWCLLTNINGKIHYLKSPDKKVFTKEVSHQLYTKAINASLFDNLYTSNQIIKLETKLLIKEPADQIKQNKLNLCQINEIILYISKNIAKRLLKRFVRR